MININLQIIKANISSQLEGKYVAPIVLAGPPGTAKSFHCKKLASDMNLALVNQSAGQLMPEILSGIPGFKPAPKMDEYSDIGATDSEATRWSVPELIEQANTLAQESNSGVLILLDDLHEISMATSPYMLEFLLERKLGQYKLDPRVAIIATMNDSDEANFSGMSSAVRNRLAILEWKFDFDSWMDNDAKFYHFYVSSFLKLHQSYAQEDESTGIEGFGTPRAYEFLSNTFASLPLDFVSKHTQKLAKQYISISAAQALSKHVAYMNSIDFSSKVKSRNMQDINILKPLDMILWGYIVNYIETVSDAEYLINLIDMNIKAHNFIGFVVGELYNKYIESNSGPKISIGIQCVLSKLLEQTLDTSAFKKADKETFDNMSFKNQEKLYSLAAEFM